MIIEVLFIVFFVLWLATIFPQTAPWSGPYSGFLPWICVGLLALHVGLLSHFG